MKKNYNSKIKIAYFGANHIINIYDNFFKNFLNDQPVEEFENKDLLDS